MKKIRVAVIGAGPAGLFTALNLDKKFELFLFEKNDIPGRKLLMAGSGMCNFTHSGDIKEFYDKYGDEKKFLRTAFSKCTNADIINFFLERGIESEEDKNGKIFPKTRKAKDILNVLINECRKNGVNLNFNESVTEIRAENGKIYLKTVNRESEFDAVVITTGGKSYPTTGSSGDGYRFAEMTGHSIVKPKPALAGVTVKEYQLAELAGLSFSEREMTLFEGNKKLREFRGDILLTKKGVSGPGILDNSRYMESGYTIKVNFAGVREDIVREDFLNMVKNDGKSGIKKFIKNYGISENMTKLLMEKIGVNLETKTAEISKEKREEIIKSLTGYSFEIGEVEGFNSAMATKGGVSLKEINPKTMESKITAGIYFAGEVMDIDGDTGGYNIQSAFSTGYLAAISINEKIRL